MPQSFTSILHWEAYVNQHCLPILVNLGTKLVLGLKRFNIVFIVSNLCPIQDNVQDYTGYVNNKSIKSNWKVQTYIFNLSQQLLLNFALSYRYDILTPAWSWRSWFIHAKHLQAVWSACSILYILTDKYICKLGVYHWIRCATIRIRWFLQFWYNKLRGNQLFEYLCKQVVIE